MNGLYSKDSTNLVFSGVSARLMVTCILLFLSSAAATIYFSRTMAGGMNMPGGWTMSMMWMTMPGYTWPLAALSFMVIWILMMIAMMMPSLVPMLSQYRRNVDHHTNKNRIVWLTWIVGAGYFFVWSVFGIVSYILGIALSAYEMQHPAISRAVPLLGGMIILTAGALQFTKFKKRQLACCLTLTKDRKPFSANAGRAWHHGMRLGLQCFRCCFGLMIILLVAGMMNLVVMAIVTAAITVERIPTAGQRFAFINGAGAVAAGSLLIAQAVAI